MAIAKLSQLYYNSHIDTSKSSALEDYNPFLPFPQYVKPENLVLGISRQTARELLADWESIPMNFRILLENSLLEIQYLADL